MALRVIGGDERVLGEGLCSARRAPGTQCGSRGPPPRRSAASRRCGACRETANDGDTGVFSTLTCNPQPAARAPWRAWAPSPSAGMCALLTSNRTPLRGLRGPGCSSGTRGGSPWRRRSGRARRTPRRWTGRERERGRSVGGAGGGAVTGGREEELTVGLDGGVSKRRRFRRASSKYIALLTPNPLSDRATPTLPDSLLCITAGKKL